MKNAEPTHLVKCSKCKGSGKTHLSEEYMVILRATAGMRKITAKAVADRIKWIGHVTAMNNRLTDLMKLEFYSRRREGRTFVYKQIKF